MTSYCQSGKIFENVVKPGVINATFGDNFFVSLIYGDIGDGDGLLLGLAHVAHLNRHSIPGIASFFKS